MPEALEAAKSALAILIAPLTVAPSHLAAAADECDRGGLPVMNYGAALRAKAPRADLESVRWEMVSRLHGFVDGCEHAALTGAAK